ncbi:hypothetical protein [Dysgonomonas macrotermitis]|nr:hypothetical protein [Dysgonomonas macrotermitis]
MDKYFVASWLISSIFHTENNSKDFNLINVIAYADYSNHAVMTYDEFFDGLKHLISIGLVIQVEKELFTTELYKNWWNARFQNKKRIYALKEISDVEKFIRKIENTNNCRNFDFIAEIKQTDFEKAIQLYLNRFENK